MHSRKFRQYLVGNIFVVKTDHNSLKYFLDQKDLSERQQKWVSKIQAFDFDIEYVKGKRNVIADSLSRRPTSCSMMDICTDWKAHLLVEYSKNRFTCEVMDGQVVDDRYWVLDDVIFYKDRIYLVPESTLKEKVLKACHDSPIVGHQGTSRHTGRSGRDSHGRVCVGELGLSALSSFLSSMSKRLAQKIA
jgi:hypothetical protein